MAELVVTARYSAAHPRRRLGIAVSRGGVECLDLGTACGEFPSFVGVGLVHGNRMPLGSRGSLELQFGPVWFAGQGPEAQGAADGFGAIARVEAGWRLRGPLHLILAPRVATLPRSGGQRLGSASLSLGLRL